MPLLRHIAGSLVFGFLLIFAFTLFVQVSTDLINWIFNMHIRFLFPRGLVNAMEDPENLIRVLTSMIFAALVTAAIFFVVKLRRRRGIFEWDEEPGANGPDGQDRENG